MGKKKDNSPQGSPESELENLKKGEEIKEDENPDGKGKHGGARPGAGRKPLEENERLQRLKGKIEAHAEEEVEIVETHKGSGEVRVVKKQRMTAILDMLATQAIKHNSIPAAKEYLDRVLGKPVQPLQHSGEINSEEQYIPNDPAILAAQKAYHAERRKQRGE